PEPQARCRANLGNGLRQIEVECVDAEKPRAVYAFDDVLERLNDAPDPLPVLRILSPFDPMIRDRQRAKRLFGFDYRIEIFVPAHKRQYGYYVFPILEGDRFVGRIDMKHRRQEDGSLHVMGLWPERGVKFGRARRQAMDAALERMRRFCGAESVTFADDYFRPAG
ncbi:MAG: winged helix DNA-binding domain-containing protein, partial [Rhodospirillaceae bacterium]|nr:winged helix DNA-binding domain-containing protein [Rhodospirillaceae bacterium]